MKINRYIVTFVLLPVLLKAQLGSIGLPFINLWQASSVTTAGIYYFNFNSNYFSTQVSNTGYVQVAIDFGNGSGNLPTTNTLTTASRGILTSTVLANFANITSIQMTSSTGNISATNTNTALIARINNFRALHEGYTQDNAMNSVWTGTGAAKMNIAATCAGAATISLASKVYHECGAGGGFNWIPSSGNQKENWIVGSPALNEIANTDYFQLWVKGTIVPLPIELTNFYANCNNNVVAVNWHTATELNCKYYELQRSNDGVSFNTITTIQGNGTTSETHSYQYFDMNASPEQLYYRLKQVDNDGTEHSFQIIDVTNKCNALMRENSFDVYPNPLKGNELQLNYMIQKSEQVMLSFCNSLGQTVSLQPLYLSADAVNSTIHIDDLAKGVYFIKIESKQLKNQAIKFIRE